MIDKAGILLWPIVILSVVGVALTLHRVVFFTLATRRNRALLTRVLPMVLADRIPPTFYAKGHYFTLSGRAPFQHLVYPMPDRAGLGIHVTLDLGGQCKFGPDVSGWPTAPDYGFEPGLEDKFYRAIRRYYPDLPDRALQPGYTGIRPKVTGPTEPAGDFLIQGPAAHGVAGLVNLFGIESPGLTACLAIAQRVWEELRS